MTLGEASARTARAYDPDGAVDLRGFAGSMTAYSAALATAVAGLGATGRRLPVRYDVADLVLGGVAAHKFSRLVAKSSVGSPLRAPFTQFDAAAGSGEHHEHARGEHGVRHTVGELVTCPFCLGVWVSTAYVVALAASPRPARAWAAVFTVVSVSDALQQVYARLRSDG